MTTIAKKFADACVEVLVREVSEKAVKALLDQSKSYISRTIEKGRQARTEHETADTHKE